MSWIRIPRAGVSARTLVPQPVVAYITTESLPTSESPTATFRSTTTAVLVLMNVPSFSWPATKSRSAPSAKRQSVYIHVTTL